MLDYHLLCIEKNITSASAMSDVTVLRLRTTTTKMASAASVLPTFYGNAQTESEALLIRSCHDTICVILVTFVFL